MKKNIPPVVGLGVVAVALALMVGVYLWRDSRRAQEVNDLVSQSVAGGKPAPNAAPAALTVPGRSSSLGADPVSGGVVGGR